MNWPKPLWVGADAQAHGDTDDGQYDSEDTGEDIVAGTVEQPTRTPRSYKPGQAPCSDQYSKVPSVTLNAEKDRDGGRISPRRDAVTEPHQCNGDEAGCCTRDKDQDEEADQRGQMCAGGDPAGCEMVAGPSRRETPARVADVDESGADHRHGCGAAAARQYPSRMSDREDAARRGQEETEPEQGKQKTWRGRGVSVDPRGGFEANARPADKNGGDQATRHKQGGRPDENTAGSDGLDYCTEY